MTYTVQRGTFVPPASPGKPGVIMNSHSVALLALFVVGCAPGGATLVKGVPTDTTDTTPPTPTGETASGDLTTGDTGTPLTTHETGDPTTGDTDTDTTGGTGSGDTGTPTVPNQPPAADAGADFWAIAWQQTGVDGSASSDPDGDALTYSWVFVAIPGANTPALSDPAAAAPTFTAVEVGTYVLELTVDDGEYHDDDQVQVDVWY